MKKVAIFILAAILSFSVVHTIVSLLLPDFSTSVVPGWHTTIYPETMITFIGSIVLLSAFLLFLFLKLFVKLLGRLFSAGKSLS